MTLDDLTQQPARRVIADRALKLQHLVGRERGRGLAVTQLLIERGADLTIRVKLPGDYERPGEIVECTPLGYALLFGGSSERTLTLLR